VREIDELNGDCSGGEGSSGREGNVKEASEKGQMRGGSASVGGAEHTVLGVPMACAVVMVACVCE
jgi:hypothetical protein